MQNLHDFCSILVSNDLSHAKIYSENHAILGNYIPKITPVLGIAARKQ